MRLDRFVFYTALGAGIWCAILTFIGWYLGMYASDLAAEFDHLVAQYAGRATLALLPVMAIIIGVYVYRQRKKKSSKDGDKPETPIEPASAQDGAGQ
jgi:membrane protein DedA with SNARE-associated domain